MDERQASGEPIRYIGGLGPAPKGRGWPFVALGVISAALLIAVIVFWNPIRALGRSAGATVAPYSLALTAFHWSADQKIVGVQNTISLTVDNTDRRQVNGLTMRFAGIDSGWQLVRASGSNQTAQLTNDGIFFPSVIQPGKSSTLSITLLPLKPSDSDIEFTLTPGQSSTPAQLDVNGQVGSAVSLSGKVREPIDSDADARFVAVFPPEESTGQRVTWLINVTNTGPVTIKGIRLSFPQTGGAFTFLIVTSDSTILPDGNTVQYGASLPPGGQTVLVLGVFPEVPGHYQLPIEVFLGQSTEPFKAANGGPQLNIDVTVS